MSQTIWALIHEGSDKAKRRVFGISFPDFPGAVASGGTVEEAIARGRACLAFHIEGMIADGEKIPPPRHFDDLRKIKQIATDMAEADLVVQVPFDPPGKQVRVNISIDDNLLRAIDDSAAANGFTRSGFIADAAKARLRGMG
jgi:predicted RNase H-like HicB family nuclease